MTYLPSSARPARQPNARAFTLVELLVVLTVMVTLAGMLTYALQAAQTDARIKRSQADVLTIGQLLQTRVNEVSLAQLSLVYGRSGLEQANAGIGNAGGTSIGGVGTQNVTAGSPARADLPFAANEQARLILMARRDLLRMVLPECQADLLYPPASLQFRTPAANGWHANVAQLKPPPQWNRMRSKAGLLSGGSIDAQYGGVNSVNGATSPATNPEYDAISEAQVAAFEAILRQDATQPHSPGDPRPQTTWTRQHESSECLYLILATTQLFGAQAIDKIPTSQIGDTDGDGFPEILDAWGRPYEFLRHPVGLRNPGIKNFDANGVTPAQQYPFDADPFDFLAADFRYDTGIHPTSGALPESAYFPIFAPPVVISAGPDGLFGLRLTFVDNDGDGTADEGVNLGYSSSAVQYPGNGANAFAPSFPGIPIVRMPDPFFDVSSVAANSTAVYEFGGVVDPPAASIATAKVGGGLGGTLNRDEAADNITSLSGGI